MMLRSLWIVTSLWILPLMVWAKPLTDQPIYLYASPLTAQFLKADGTSYDVPLARWRKYLKKYGKNFKEINREELLSKLQPGVLVLASAQFLDDDERKAIHDFSTTGGSLLATGATGSRDGAGQLKGDDFLHSLFKVRVLGRFNSNNDWFIMPFGDGPLTWPLSAGRRMSVGKAPENLLRIESPHLAAVFMDWIRSKDDVGPNGAIALHESDTHRGVFFAFPESVWGFHKPADMSLMLDSTLAWLRREPKLFKAAWPAGNVAAHLIEMDTEDKFFSAPRLADHLEKIGVRGTFYCLTSEAIKYPAIVKDLLARGHEIAYHADIHIGFKGTEPAQQESRIKAMKEQMRTILGEASSAVTGFRAPTEGYDVNTEILLRKNGILHHAADPSSHQDRLPFFSNAEPEVGTDQSIVVLPRTQFDDVNFKRLVYGAPRVEATLAYDLDLVVKSGAFGLLSVHSQNYVDGGLMRETMGNYMEKVATYKDRLWIARGDQITAWWRKRELVKVKQAAHDKGSLLQLSISTPGNVDDLTVFVTHPTKNAQPSVQTLDAKAAKVKIKQVDPFRSALVFSPLQTGDFEYLVRFP